MEIPEFATAYREARRQAFGQSIARLQQASTAAVSTLLTVMIDPGSPASVRVRAPDSVLGHAKTRHRNRGCRGSRGGTGTSGGIRETDGESLLMRRAISKRLEIPLERWAKPESERPVHHIIFGDKSVPTDLLPGSGIHRIAFVKAGAVSARSQGDA